MAKSHTHVWDQSRSLGMLLDDEPSCLERQHLVFLVLVFWLKEFKFNKIYNLIIDFKTLKFVLK